MALDVAPDVWLASWAEDGTDITLPIASLPELSVAEADGTTGDIRDVVHAFLSALQVHYDSLDVADRPVRMVMTKTSTTNAADTTATLDFRVQLTVDLTEGDVADEPA